MSKPQNVPVRAGRVAFMHTANAVTQRQHVFGMPSTRISWLVTEYFHGLNKTEIGP